jgi:hypothetical protein
MKDQKQTPPIELLKATDLGAREDSLQLLNDRG